MSSVEKEWVSIGQDGSDIDFHSSLSMASASAEEKARRRRITFVVYESVKACTPTMDVRWELIDGVVRS